MGRGSKALCGSGFCLREGRERGEAVPLAVLIKTVNDKLGDFHLVFPAHYKANLRSCTVLVSRFIHIFERYKSRWQDFPKDPIPAA